MAGLITGTWTLISSSAEMITGARRMTMRIHRMLQPGLLELSESDRRRLLGLQKRVDCLAQPLNFLLLWSKERDSCVQHVVLNAQELLSDVCRFVDCYFPQDGTTAIRSGTAGENQASPGGGIAIDSEQLDFFLRELEFACASVSMAVSIARASEVLPQVPGGGGGGVSPSALLRASRRIQEMRRRSGDLCVCPGRLYTQAACCGSGGGAGGACRLLGQRGEEREEKDARAASWVPSLSLAALKVVAAADGRQRRRRYGLVVESRLPISLEEESLSSMDDCGIPSASSAGRAGLNAGPQHFPIEAALNARITTSTALGLPPVSPQADLGVDELVLLWTGPSTSSAASLTGNGASTTAAAGLASYASNGAGDEAAACMDNAASRPFWDRGRAASPIQWPKPAPGAPAAPGASFGGGRYAFVFDGLRISEEPGSEQVVQTPLDTLYLARLCAHDDGHEQLFPVEAASGGCGVDSSGGPPHLLSSDEVLSALLMQQEAQ